MKTLLKTAFIFASYTALGASTLVLDTEKSIYRTDENITVILRLDDIELSPAPASIPTYVTPPKSAPFPSSTTDDAFVYRFRLRAGEAGDRVIGPYLFKFGGQSLTSNSKTIKIIPTDFKGIEVVVDRTNTRVGESFCVMLRYKGKEIKGIRWRKNALVMAENPTATSSSQTINGQTDRFASLEFHVTAKKTGVLEISKSSFDGIPNDWSLPSTKLIIEK